MTKKRVSINDVLDELHFNQKEKEGFRKCINAIKTEQNDPDYNAEDIINKVIEEVISNEDEQN